MSVVIGWIDAPLRACMRMRYVLDAICNLVDACMYVYIYIYECMYGSMAVCIYLCMYVCT